MHWYDLVINDYDILMSTPLPDEKKKISLIDIDKGFKDDDFNLEKALTDISDTEPAK